MDERRVGTVNDANTTIATRVREVLRRNAQLSTDLAKLADDADLYEAGMSSRASVGVMLGLENEFEIEFPDSMLRRDVFASVSAIAAAVRSLGANAT